MPRPCGGLHEERKASLIVTVDCGISAIEEAELARELGVELIITDHHTIGPELPAADVIVHPRLPGSAYPTGDLCGAGVAFKLAWQVCKSFGDGKRASPHLRNFLVSALGPRRARDDRRCRSAFRRESNHRAAWAGGHFLGAECRASRLDGSERVAR